ncbi:hypothetical protein SUDANB121_05253 [Nocardiopsis dassonvillei]|uniref:hypothetical protein n=1 Tax=Nocardiopsis dassonvillei TaxID=2014 RepID=UPI003F57B975
MEQERCTLAARALLSGHGPADAYLLRAPTRSHRGPRAAFPDAVDRGAADGGRGVPDGGTHDPGVLPRRGAAFARSVPAPAARGAPDRPVTARVSAAPVLTAPEVHTGYVAFASARYAGGRVGKALGTDGPVPLLRGPGR